MTTTYIEINLYRNGLVSDTLSILQEAGWGTFGDNILYEHYREDDGPDELIEADEEHWSSVKNMLDVWSASGETVCVNMRMSNSDVVVRFCFESSTRLIIQLFGSRPALVERHKLTDFSKLLEEVAIPLLDAGIKILGVTCTDDFM